MKVYELIEKLNKIEDKNKDVDLMVRVGYGELVSCDSGFEVDNGDGDVVVLYGEGDWSQKND